MSYLAIKRWEHFQHYSGRRPIWIKLYVELLDDQEMRKLSPPTRLLWIQLLLLAARHDNAILFDVSNIAKSVSLSKIRVAESIAELIAGGWIVERKTRLRRRSRASTSLAENAAAASNTGARPRARERQKQKEPVSNDSTSTTDPRSASAPSAGKGLSISHSVEVEKLLAWIGRDADNGTGQVVRTLAEKLPEAAVASIVDASTKAKPKNRAGYIVEALKAQIANVVASAETELARARSQPERPDVAAQVSGFVRSAAKSHEWPTVEAHVRRLLEAVPDEDERTTLLELAADVFGETQAEAPV